MLNTSCNTEMENVSRDVKLVYSDDEKENRENRDRKKRCEKKGKTSIKRTY